MSGALADSSATCRKAVSDEIYNVRVQISAEKARLSPQFDVEKQACNGKVSCVRAVNAKETAAKKAIDAAHAPQLGELAAKQKLCNIKLQAQTPKLDTRFQGTVTENVPWTPSAYDLVIQDAGRVLPAMHGEFRNGAKRLFIDLQPGWIVGQGAEGPVRNVGPGAKPYGFARGGLVSPSQFHVTFLTDAQGRPITLPPDGLFIDLSDVR